MGIQQEVAESFAKHFGRTPLKERLDDILSEAIELKRFTDMDNLREEAGDLLASTMQLCTEAGWDAEALVRATLEKIASRSLQYQSLGRKTTVAILGGAFDPPTLGHIDVAQYVLNTSRTFDEVWLMPCYQHMYGKEMREPEHRRAMCEIAARKDGRIKVFNFEIERRLSSETYKTVKLLLDQDFAKNEYDFSIIIGMDNANTFDKWVNYELLEQMIRFVVVPREGVVRDESVDWYLKPPHIYLGSAEFPIRDTASSKVREAYSRIPAWERKGNPEQSAERFGPELQLIEDMLDPAVREYIDEHNTLY